MDSIQPHINVPESEESLEELKEEEVEPPRKRGRGRPPGAKTRAKVDIAMLPPRKRHGDDLPGPPSKERKYITRETPEPDQINTVTDFETEIYVELARLSVSGRGGKNARAIKDESCQTLGPFVMDQDTSWGELISKIASELECTPETVVLTGMS